MKKSIILLVVFFCATMSVWADDKVNVTYTRYGTDVELVTTTYHNNRSSKVLYGLRKKGVVIMKDCELAIDDDLRIFVFYNKKQAAVYRMHNAEKLSEVTAGTKEKSFENGKIQIERFVDWNGFSHKTITLFYSDAEGKKASKSDLGTFYRVMGETHKHKEKPLWK